MRAGFIALLFAASLPIVSSAQDAGRLGLLVLDADRVKVHDAADAALSDPSPLLRATAARLANVRNDVALLDDLRTALAKESDANAAREEVRALLMLGGNAERDRALEASKRFDGRLDHVIDPTPSHWPLALPSRMPAGLGAALLAEAKCKGGWLGSVHVTIDDAGRVTETNLKNVSASRACTTALDALLRLSIAETPSRRSEVAVVESGRDPCLDEAPLRSGSGNETKVPRLVKRVQPDPQAMRGVDADFEITARITWRGCMSDIALTKASRDARANSAVLVAASQWMFEPGTEGGEPVDVKFAETVTVRSHVHVMPGGH